MLHLEYLSSLHHMIFQNKWKFNFFQYLGFLT